MSRHLIGKSVQQLEEIVAKRGWPRFKARQLESWMYTRGARSLHDMHNLGKSFIESLLETRQTDEENEQAAEVSACSSGQISETAPWLDGRAGRVLTKHQDSDGTIKWLVGFGENGSDDSGVEAVYIPEVDRGTLCISTQVGCSLRCKFCQTGEKIEKSRLRNLHSEEILSQVLLAKDELNDWSGDTSVRAVTNIVFMGQGEPLFNYRSVAKAIEVLSSPSSMSIGRPRIIVSTSGVVPNIYKLADEFPQVTLAVSLHAPNDELRSQIMDVNDRWNIATLMKALDYHQAQPKVQRLTFEYVLLAGVNDLEEHAHQLVDLIKPRFPSCIVNLIPFNSWLEDSPFKTPSIDSAVRFQDILTARGVPSPIRRSRGSEIQAACGQLSMQSVGSRSSETPKSRLVQQ